MKARKLSRLQSQDVDHYSLVAPPLGSLDRLFMSSFTFASLELFFQNRAFRPDCSCSTSSSASVRGRYSDGGTNANSPDRNSSSRWRRSRGVAMVQFKESVRRVLVDQRIGQRLKYLDTLSRSPFRSPRSNLETCVRGNSFYSVCATFKRYWILWSFRGICRVPPRVVGL